MDGPRSSIGFSGMGYVRLTLFGLVLAVLWCNSQAFLNYNYNNSPDSDDHGVSRGQKGTTCECGYTNKKAGRIVGGKATETNEYPYMAAVGKNGLMGGVSLFCGGTIITNYHVMTAAHCTHGVTAQLSVIVGSHASQGPDSAHRRVHPVHQIIQHPEYNPTTIRNDISLLVTHIKIQFTAQVGPACLPLEQPRIDGQWLKVTGWGHTQWKGKISPVLKKVNLRAVSPRDCSGYYRNVDVTQNSQFCTYRPLMDSCQGDSGGPVVWLDPETNRLSVVGVVSYGKDCASPNPGVNTNVHAYMSWIQDSIKRSTAFDPSAKACHKRL